MPHTLDQTQAYHYHHDVTHPGGALRQFTSFRTLTLQLWGTGSPRHSSLSGLVPLIICSRCSQRMSPTKSGASSRKRSLPRLHSTWPFMPNLWRLTFTRLNSLVAHRSHWLTCCSVHSQGSAGGGGKDEAHKGGGDTEEGGREAGGTPGLSASSTRAPKTNETRETPQVKSATLSTVLEVRVQLAGPEPKLAPGNQVSAPLGVTPDAKAYRSSAARLQAGAGWQERPAVGTHSWGCPGGAAPSGSR